MYVLVLLNSLIGQNLDFSVSFLFIILNNRNMKYKLQIHLKFLLPLHNVLSSKHLVFLIQQSLWSNKKYGKSFLI